MVKLLFDHNMPPAIARGVHEVISASGHEAHALRERFAPDISDIDLFRELGGKPGWVLISKDLKQARRKAEKAALKEAGLLAFYLSASLAKLDHCQQAATILWHFDGINQQRQLLESGQLQLPIKKGSKFRIL